MVTVSRRVKRTCGGGRLIATVDYTDREPGYSPIYVNGVIKRAGGAVMHAALGTIHPGQVKSFGLGGNDGDTVSIGVSYSHYWSGPSVSATMNRIFPNLSLQRLNFSPNLCSGVKESIKAVVAETGGRCGGNFHLKWLDNRTKSLSIPVGGMTEVPLDFTVPEKPLDISVELFDEERNTTVGTRIASIDPKIPDVDISDFNIPKLTTAGEFCIGKKIDGSILIKVLECAQELRGKVMDTVSGKTFASFGPEKYSPSDRIKPNFSFSMPRNPVSLKAMVEGKTDGGWETIGSKKRNIGFLKPSTSIGSFEIPDRACADKTIGTSVDVIAEECPQRLRGRLVDRFTGNVIQPWTTVELGPGKSTSFKFPFSMPRRNIPLRVDVERFDPVAGTWERIGSKEDKVEQKDPVMGTIIGREVADYARPGFSTKGSVTVKNSGECGGDVRVEGFIGGSRILREDYTLGPGKTKTATYAANMPPTRIAEVKFEVSSMRAERKVTSRIIDSITAARAVVLDKGAITIRGGDNGYSYSGVIIAKNVDWGGPEVIEEKNPISSFRPLKRRLRPYIFAGKVDAKAQEQIKFEPGSIAYLKMTTGVGNSWINYGNLRNKDAKTMTYSAIEYPTVLIRSELTEISDEKLAKIGGIT